MILPFATPADPDDAGRKIVEARHREYTEFHKVWRWLEDSLEGGERYREADYGQDPYLSTWTWTNEETGETRTGSNTHQIPRRNLIRHPSEYPTSTGPGTTAGAIEQAPSTADEYEFRRALTPVPGFVAEAIGTHLARIYAREVRRECPEGPRYDAVRKWWLDVDGTGTSVDEWMQEVVAPLFLDLGQLDLAFDHPPNESGSEVKNQADVVALGLDAVVACYILPENVTDWTLDLRKRYVEATVRERDEAGNERFRHWTAEGSQLYDPKGKPIGPFVPHRYGRVPIFRAFDVRKARCNNVGQSRYDGIAQLQRAYYNVDSELTLSNSLAAHAILSGPENYTRGDEIRLGPGNVLPMKAYSDGAGYQGWEYVCPPSEAADKLRQKLNDYRDEADRAACLTKPAGAQGTDGKTVSQSGVSKMLDQSTGNDLLGKIAKALGRLERQAVEMVLTVANNGPIDPAWMDEVVIAYPTKFDLFTAADLGALISEFQGLASGVDGELPEATGQYLRSFIRASLPGLDDDEYDEIDAEIDAYIAKKAKDAEARAELPPLAPPGMPKPPVPDPNAEPPVDPAADDEPAE